MVHWGQYNIFLLLLLIFVIIVVALVAICKGRARPVNEGVDEKVMSGKFDF